MKKAYPPRPNHDFRITCFDWSLKHEAKRREAGFAPVESKMLVRRFWQYVCFLQENELTTTVIARSETEIFPETSLRNSDLTELGYLFAQRYNDRWAARAYKDTGAVNEEKFLVKWFKQLRATVRDA